MVYIRGELNKSNQLDVVLNLAREEDAENCIDSPDGVNARIRLYIVLK